MPIGLKDFTAALALLAETYPQCFTAEQHLPHQPLKIGIDRDLAERCPALNSRERSATMQFYASRIMYLQSLVEGAGRVDLDGNVCGEVTASDAEHALSRIAGIMAARDTEVAAAKAAREARKAIRPTAPIVQTVPEPLPTAAPANGVGKLKGRPLLTLPAFRRVAAS